MPEFAATTLRTCLRFGLFILAFPLLAHAGLPLSSSVPGGVAVIPLGSVTGDTHTPQTWLGDRPVLVTADHNEWYAVVGLPLDITPGQHQLRVKIGDITKEQDFTVSTKEGQEQGRAVGQGRGARCPRDRKNKETETTLAHCAESRTGFYPSR
jgi:hypothetical protein